MAPQIIIKDKIEDGVELDLSLSDLQDVPVKEISLYKKIHTIDLSNNHLIKLPTTFPTLTHLIKLDLSKNKLKELPANFGDLIKLKHLDLYKNQLEHLPLSFGKLKHLRWLDLKDNPLYPAIKDVAGQCLDGKQCQKCAKDIVQFYTTLNSKVECERAIREEQRLRSRLDNERKSKEEKTNRKKKKMAQRASEEANKKVDDLRNNKTIHDGKEVNKTVDVKVTKKLNNSFRQMIASTSKCIISLVFILTLTIGLLDFYSETETAKLIKTTLHRFIPEEYLENVSLFLRNCLAKFHCLKETIKNNSMANSFFASVSNQMNVIYDGFRKKLKDYL